jgi:carboxyl-terminal processing protease
VVDYTKEITDVNLDDPYIKRAIQYFIEKRWK